MNRAIALALVLLAATPARAEDSTVTTDDGPVTGVVKKREGAPDVVVFKGIPYAAPPTGERRWRPPVRPAPWKEPRACTTYAPACPQPNVPIFPIPEGQAEDCLYLNVFTPKTEASAKLPVLVWIHGGSFVAGSGAQALFDGEPLARRGAVVVTLNYRLGPFGWFSHPALAREAGRPTSGNQGLLDQVAALEWVKRNVAGFGGDPGCVTVFGESAGSISVGALLLSPLAKGLFHRAICQSGTIFARAQRDTSWGIESAERTGERIAAALGGDKAKDPLAALRAKSAAEVLAAGKPQINPIGAENSFGPVVDGWSIPDDPVALLTAGRQHDVPLLLGTTAHEGSVFVALSREARSRDAFRAFVRATFGKEGAERLLEHYEVPTDDAAPRAFSELIGDALFVAPARAVARSRARLASRTFLYSFTRVPPSARILNLGAHHGAELAYVFQNLDPPAARGMTAEDRALSDTIAQAWLRFARTGDPNGEGLPRWPAYTPENDAHLELGDEVKTGDGLRKAECDLFESVWAKLGAAEKTKSRKRL